MKRWVVLLMLVFGGCATSEKKPAPLFQVEVRTGDYDRVDPIVSYPIAADIDDLELFETTSGLRTPVASQIDMAGDERRLYWVLKDDTERGMVRTFAAFPVPADPQKRQKHRERLAVKNEEGHYLEVRYGDAPIFRYNYGVVDPPSADIDPLQARNAYIHPVWTPAGRIVTDDYNPDHLHQRGIWNAWTHTEFEGRTPDFWNLGDGKGTVRFEKIEMVQGGPVFAGFRVRHRHVDLKAPGGEKDVLTETWNVRVYAVGGPQAGFFLFDIDSIEQCAGQSPLQLPEYHYGGMGLRGARGWTPEVVRFLTSQGKDRKQGDGSPADWCLIEGPVDKQPAGIMVMSSPQNFRAPQPVRIHPEMPYFVFSPQQAGAMAIEPGTPYHSRYRYLVYDGSLQSFNADSFWHDYAEAPEVRPIEASPQ